MKRLVGKLAEMKSHKTDYSRRLLKVLQRKGKIQWKEPKYIPNGEDKCETTKNPIQAKMKPSKSEVQIK
ncbi:hypothetical protein AVEN_255061-1, partial [Araneus ventricosus]